MQRVSQSTAAEKSSKSEPFFSSITLKVILGQRLTWAFVALLSPHLHFGKQMMIGVKTVYVHGLSRHGRGAARQCQITSREEGILEYEGFRERTDMAKSQQAFCHLFGASVNKTGRK